MDTFRHVLTLLMLMFMPGAVLFWFLVHPFVRFWRRLGLLRRGIRAISRPRPAIYAAME
jgi:hypothetical protein